MMAIPKTHYNPDQIEKKWQQFWEEKQLFQTPEDRSKPKYYVLDMFPYPSGAGLHVGHPAGYTATDIIARYKRMRGFNVLHPMGWDAFGLPAERAAMREGAHPQTITERNIHNFRRQIKRLGLSYDWSREINTSDPSYYGWTQTIFLKLYEKGLAYLADVPVNWCPAQGTVLANEEVQHGRYIETGDKVEKRMMRQWMLRITQYAERLLNDLEELDWPEHVKELQRQWIGRSEGAEIDFPVLGHASLCRVFTSRPETLWGVTFCLLAPEHPLLEHIVTAGQQEAVEQYRHHLAQEFKKDKANTLEKESSGVFTGAFAEHPITKDRLPIWVSSDVRMDYGTGALMGVPAHDERDKRFASQFGLASKRVLDEQQHLIHSDFINGMDITAARTHLVTWLETHGVGRHKVCYKMRDWLFSRQRYWGEPMPILFDSFQNPQALPTEELPLLLPELNDFKPTVQGEPPLARATDWVNVQTSTGQILQRETNTMPQWAASCWYYLRFMDPLNSSCPFDPEAAAYWGPVDLYVGGIEHAVSHLLYARFWHKVLFDCGWVTTKEPFQKLFNQGMILGTSYRDEQGKYYAPSEVTRNGEHYYSQVTQQRLSTQIEKMSKSKLNVVNPDDIVDQYGADSLRLYEMFLGPLEAVKPWQTSGVKGMYQFLERVYQWVSTEAPAALHRDRTSGAEVALMQALAHTVYKVTHDIEHLKFNTAIAKMMEFLNFAQGFSLVTQDILERFVIILSPFAPHLAEELWEKLGHQTSVSTADWPQAPEESWPSANKALGLHVNGKKRAEIFPQPGIDSATLLEQAAQHPKIKPLLNTPYKTVLVPGKLINFIMVNDN